MGTVTEERSAIAVHHTATSDGAWDGPANEARLDSDRDAAYYRRAFAYQNPDTDGTSKAHFRFVHHLVDGEGNPGAASVRACQTGIGVLNGARGGSVLEGADRAGVYRHLAAHLRDADLEPPDLRDRAQRAGLERRTYPFALRAALDGEARVIRGHAAVFNRDSLPLADVWGDTFVERIAPGAFAKTIQESDVRALFNHNPDLVLGRMKAGTLALAEDRQGLAVEIQAPETNYARDLMRSMARGDVDQMSFGFWVVKDQFVYDREQQLLTRTLLEVGLQDVSVVTFPAYPDTDAGVTAVRLALIAQGLDPEQMAEALVRMRAGEPLSYAQRSLVRSLTQQLHAALPPEPDPTVVHSEEPAEPARRHEPSMVGHSVAWRKRQFEALTA